MANDTREMIFDTFIELLKTRPFDKITVSSIVENCGINRNTFYYHYTDVYELLEEMFKVETSDIKSGSRWYLAFSRLLETCYRNKKVIANICASRSYEYLENYMFKSSRVIMSDFITGLAEGRKIENDKLEFIISFMQYGITGIVSEWFRTGMPDKPSVVLRRLRLMFEGLMPVLDMAEKKDPAE